MYLISESGSIVNLNSFKEIYILEARNYKERKKVHEGEKTPTKTIEEIEERKRKRIKDPLIYEYPICYQVIVSFKDNNYSNLLYEYETREEAQKKIDELFEMLKAEEKT